jgi:hypothetical protein
MNNLGLYFKNLQGYDNACLTDSQQNPKAQHRQYQDLLLLAILSQFDAPSIFTTYIPVIHLNDISPSPRSSEWTLSRRLIH